MAESEAAELLEGLVVGVAQHGVGREQQPALAHPGDLLGQARVGVEARSVGEPDDDVLHVWGGHRKPERASLRDAEPLGALRPGDVAAQHGRAVAGGDRGLLAGQLLGGVGQVAHGLHVLEAQALGPDLALLRALADRRERCWGAVGSRGGRDLRLRRGSSAARGQDQREGQRPPAGRGASGASPPAGRGASGASHETPVRPVRARRPRPRPGRWPPRSARRCPGGRRGSGRRPRPSRRRRRRRSS